MPKSTVLQTVITLTKLHLSFMIDSPVTPIYGGVRTEDIMVSGCFHHLRFDQGTFHPNVCTSVQLYHPTIKPPFITSMGGQTVRPYTVLHSASMLSWHPYGGVRLGRLGRMYNTDPCFPVHPCFPMLPCFQVLPCFPEIGRAHV